MLVFILNIARDLWNTAFGCSLSWFEYSSLLQMYIRAPLPQCAPILHMYIFAPMCPTLTNVYLCPKCAPNHKCAQILTNVHLCHIVSHFLYVPQFYNYIYIYTPINHFLHYPIYFNYPSYPNYPIYPQSIQLPHIKSNC